jgi:hypothetical protein
MLKRFMLTLAVVVPMAATASIVAPTAAEAQWGPPPPRHWGPPPPPRWGGPPPRHWGWRPPPPRCWTERQRVWVDGPWGPRRVWQNVRVCR